MTGDQLYRTRQAAIADVREYVAVYYNSKRLPSKLGYKMPLDYEKDLSRCSEFVDHYRLTVTDLLLDIILEDRRLVPFYPRQQSNIW